MSGEKIGNSLAWDWIDHSPLITHHPPLQLYHKYKAVATNFLTNTVLLEVYQKRTPVVSLTNGFVLLVMSNCLLTKIFRNWHISNYSEHRTSMLCNYDCNNGCLQIV